MLLFLTIIDRQGEDRQFSCQLDKLEDGLDFLNSLVAKGETLLKVFFIDNGQVTDLPVEAFDGLSCSKSINEMESEWKAILKTTLLTSRSSQEIDEYNQVLLARCETRIVDLELLITRVNGRFQRAKIYQGLGVSLAEHYQSIITRYQNHLIFIYALRDRFLKHLISS